MKTERWLETQAEELQHLAHLLIEQREYNAAGTALAMLELNDAMQNSLAESGALVAHEWRLTKPKSTRLEFGPGTTEP